MAVDFLLLSHFISISGVPKYHLLYGSVLDPFYGLLCTTLRDCAHYKSAKLLNFHRF